MSVSHAMTNNSEVAKNLKDTALSHFPINQCLLDLARCAAMNHPTFVAIAAFHGRHGSYAKCTFAGVLLLVPIDPLALRSVIDAAKEMILRKEQIYPNISELT